MVPRLELKAQQRISPQLVIASKLLQQSGVEFEQTLHDELQRNPALERVTLASPVRPEGDWRSGSWQRTRLAASQGRHSQSRLQQASENVPAQTTAVERLIAQAALMLERRDQPIAVYLLHRLDAHGYLRESPEVLAAEIGVSITDVGRVIQVLQQLDPPGIAARNLCECLRLQCQHLLENGADAGLALRILDNAWDDFVNQRWSRMARRLDAKRSAIDEACRLMARYVYPYPLLLLESATANEGQFRTVDLVIQHEQLGDKVWFRLYLPGQEAYELRVATSFETAVQNGVEGNLSPEEKVWITKQVERARLFIAAAHQRWVTLRRVGEQVIAQQTSFLKHGPQFLQPLTRAGIAAEMGLHESTVGRAIRGKVVQLPGGKLMPLEAFFDNSLVAKDAIQRLLAQTHEPLSDRQIAERLQGEGLPVARRTVTKYRQQLKIPAARFRQSPAVLAR